MRGGEERRSDEMAPNLVAIFRGPACEWYI